jgi:hypothetical protein
MLQLTAERPTLNVVYDKCGTPTYALYLARSICTILQDYGQTENGKLKTENEVIEKPTEELPVIPIAPIEEEVEEEPEVEVELIFDEEAEGDSEEIEDRREEIEDESEEIEENLSTLNSQLSTPKRSALLSLYEDNPAPVLGEQFHDKPSVADAIACPKGVAESAPVASLREAIGVADKFMLIRELFGGDADAYEKAIDALEVQPSFDDCIIYIAEHYTWSPNSQATKLVMELLQRKYNA